MGRDIKKRKEYEREYYLKHRDKIILRSKEWHKNNRERDKKRLADYYVKHREKLVGDARRYYNEKPFILRWAQRTLYGHKRDGCVVEMTPNELVEIAESHKTCQFCGVDLIFYNESRGKGKRYWHCVSLDRKDNERSINKDNVLILCVECNMVKGIKPLAKFQDYCKMIAGKDFSCV